MKYYDNPYFTECWNSMKQSQKEKDEIDNEVAFWMIKFTALLMSVGVVFLLLKR